MSEVHSLMASASYDQTVRIWDVGSGRHVTTIPHSDSQVFFKSLVAVNYAIFLFRSTPWLSLQMAINWL